jgi:glyoxylate/hydroxypyruvate reductase A
VVTTELAAEAAGGTGRRALLYKSEAQRGREWQALFAEWAPELSFRIWPDVGDARDILYVAVWDPPDRLTERFPNLEVVFSIGAGVDQLDLSSIPESIPVVRMVDPGISAGIVEYVCMASLALHRHLPDYIAAQRERRWAPIRLVPAARRRVGVMGLGNLGQAIIDRLGTFGFPRYGWSRTPRDISGVECFAGDDALSDFLAHCDILICMLPLTPATRGILNDKLFSALPAGASLINVGRGAQLCEQGLLKALETGQVSNAILDVMPEEPPPADHPFWHDPRILLTPHVAAMTQAESAAKALFDNIRRHETGRPMLGVVDRAVGY